MSDGRSESSPGVGRPIGANPSFVDLIAASQPPLRSSGSTEVSSAELAVPHGTTVLGLKFSDGVVMAGDRRATEGYSIADDKMDKVFPADDLSAISIAGAAGQAVEIVKLFQLELEHYEKLEGRSLSLEGKANRLSAFVRGNLGAAMQGLVVVPLFAGYDEETGKGRIFSYDVAGGRYEEHDFHSIGSGSVFARGSLKKLWRPSMARADVIRVAVEALYDAADDDSATGGPDLVRKIFPLIMLATAEGTARVSDDEIGGLAEAIVAERTANPV